jgi:aminoglycoside phosphotransferase (APT) family kinase protein
VYEYGPGKVLRRYRTPLSAEREARTMDYVRSRGFPAPEVFEVDGTDLVMQRVAGRTMLAEFSHRPWAVPEFARTLASLHHRLHALHAPDWVPDGFGDGDALLHMDLHPDNVMLTTDGPVVIDWPNAKRGAGEADVAYAWMLMASATVPDVRFRSLLVGGRSVFLRMFLRHFDRDAVARMLPVVLPHWTNDRNSTEPEREAARRLAARNGDG